MSAHWDHITVGAAALKIAKTLKIQMAAFTMSDERLTSLRKDFFLTRRKFGKYAGIPKHRKGDIKIKVDVLTKRRAMRSHVSQFGAAGPFSQLAKRDADKMFAYEHFVQEKI